MRGLPLAILAVLALVLAPGCLEPFRVRVDPVLVSASPGWVVTPDGVQGDLLGAKHMETRYAFDRDPDDPVPFAGSLQVLSIRSLARLDTGKLLDVAQSTVERGARESSIELSDGGASGSRTLSSGVTTSWFVREGRTTQSGALFEQGVRVRIVGEVGRDGRSDTSFVVVGMAQVSRTNNCPLIGACQPEETNLQTWIQIVGDAEGTIEGATSSAGFIDHLVTR